MQARMARRLAQWYPAPDEIWPTIACGCVNWSQVQWRRRGHTVAASLWCWAGHAARLPAWEPRRLIAAGLGLRGAWWRQTLRHLHAKEAARMPRTACTAATACWTSAAGTTPFGTSKHMHSFPCSDSHIVAVRTCIGPVSPPPVPCVGTTVPTASIGSLTLPTYLSRFRRCRCVGPPVSATCAALPGSHLCWICSGPMFQPPPTSHGTLPMSAIYPCTGSINRCVTSTHYGSSPLALHVEIRYTRRVLVQHTSAAVARSKLAPRHYCTCLLTSAGVPPLRPTVLTRPGSSLQNARNDRIRTTNCAARAKFVEEAHS